MSKSTERCCPEVVLAESLAPEWFRSLADPVRLQVVVRLAVAGGALTVGEVSDCCGVHLSGVSRHLKILREAGVVSSEKSGREVRYRLACGALVARLRLIADALEGSAAASSS